MTGCHDDDDGELARTTLDDEGRGGGVDACGQR